MTKNSRILGRLPAHYFDSWWLPAVVFLILLGVFAIAAIPPWRPFQFLATALFFATGVAFLGIVVAAIGNLVKRRWAKGLVNLLLVPVCGLAAFAALGFVMVASMFGPSEDGFADNLEIPAGLSIELPGKDLEPSPGSGADQFQATLLAALQAPGGMDSTVSATVAALQDLENRDPSLLRRYLAASPAWRLFKERGNIVATRRWMIGSEWSFSLHGYYTRHDLDQWRDGGIPDFQCRMTIGLSGKPWWRGNKNTTQLAPGETAKAIVTTDNQMTQSHCVITAGSTVVEVFEQAGTPERRLTRAALNFVQAELNLLAENPSWETARRILPPDSIRTGKTSFKIRDSFQPGIYDSSLWLNPGEPGMVYLKAFEVTKGTSLSSDRLKEATNEWIGWSDDPEELFFANAHFTIYEGDWGKPYAARLEVWFAPDSGAPERKLLEKVFKVEGWQR